jgi:ribosomal protein L31
MTRGNSFKTNSTITQTDLQVVNLTVRPFFTGQAIII